MLKDNRIKDAIYKKIILHAINNNSLCKHDIKSMVLHKTLSLVQKVFRIKI